MDGVFPLTMIEPLLADIECYVPEEVQRVTTVAACNVAEAPPEKRRNQGRKAGRKEGPLRLESRLICPSVTEYDSGMNNESDYLIIGAGIVGLALASRLKARHPQSSITILEKEPHAAAHASGRNSGVLHAGFYYTADSLKAKFTVAGNRAWREYCAAHKLDCNTCGKLVVAQNAQEVDQLYELQRRGQANGSEIELISRARAEEIEPNVSTHELALWSPLTATIDPLQVCETLRQELVSQGVRFYFSTAFVGRSGDQVQTTGGMFTAGKIINCAGLYADKVARAFGFGARYLIVPFKGLYLKYVKNSTDIRTNIYPVPNLKNPFLGVHFTKTVHDEIKIGPTAIPAFWREHYTGFENFRLGESVEILTTEAKLFLTNAFGFRSLAFEEMRKYSKRYLIGLAQSLVKHIDPAGFGPYVKPGIRAQLLERSTSRLVQDFVVEGDSRSVHVLNAVSPAFTCALPFADYVIERYVEKG